MGQNLLPQQSHSAQNSQAIPRRSFFSETRLPLAQRILKPARFAAFALAFLTLINFAFPAPGQKRQSPSLSLEGWSAQIDFSPPAAYIIYDVQGGDTLLATVTAYRFVPDSDSAKRIEYSRLPLYEPWYADPGWLMMYGALGADTLSLSSVRLPFSPVKPTSLRISEGAISGSDTLISPSADTLIFPKAAVLEKHGIKVLMERDEYKHKANEMIDAANEINRLITPPDFPPIMLYSNYNHLQIEYTVLDSKYECHLGMNGNIFMNAGIFGIPTRYPIHRMAIFHEAAHVYNMSGMSDPQTSLGLEICYNLATSLYPGLDGKHNPILALFDESHYLDIKLDSSRGDYGHIYGDDALIELFASGSSVLRFFPSEFFERAASLDAALAHVPRKPLRGIPGAFGLGDDDLQPSAIALRIARSIASSYGPEGPFTPNVYNKLGLR